MDWTGGDTTGDTSIHQRYAYTIHSADTIDWGALDTRVIYEPWHARSTVSTGYVYQDPQPHDNVVFTIGGEEILKIDKDGMHYKNVLIRDAGEAHAAFVKAMDSMYRYNVSRGTYTPMYTGQIQFVDDPPSTP